MTVQSIGLLHPGEMGISLAASAQNGGHAVAWASEGRSAATRARAEAHGLRDAGTLARLCAECAVLVCVCPPDAAEAVAHDVAALGFTGLYLDANAISPGRAARLGEALSAAGADFVDGGLLGGPAWEPGGTTLYLSGSRAEAAAACFAAGPLRTQVLGLEIGAASALKMCYSAYNKGTTALLGAILAAAEQLGVRPALEAAWDQDDAEFSARAARRVRRSTRKAWRFAGEMDEIADTLRGAGLPGDFHRGAAIVFQRLAHYKEEAELPALEEVLAALATDL